MQQLWIDGVRQERTGFRCAEISLRHRLWGYNCPAVDLDFLVAEYNHGKPVALIEYKHNRAWTQDYDHPTYAALKSLANGYNDGALPFLVAFYYPEDWWFRVVPLNAAASARYQQWQGRPMTERQFVRSLYLMRKSVLTRADEAAIARLNEILPRNGLDR